MWDARFVTKVILQATAGPAHVAKSGRLGSPERGAAAATVHATDDDLVAPRAARAPSLHPLRHAHHRPLRPPPSPRPAGASLHLGRGAAPASASAGPHPSLRRPNGESRRAVLGAAPLVATPLCSPSQKTFLFGFQATNSSSSSSTGAAAPPPAEAPHLPQPPPSTSPVGGDSPLEKLLLQLQRSSQVTTGAAPVVTGPPAAPAPPASVEKGPPEQQYDAIQSLMSQLAKMQMQTTDTLQVSVIGLAHFQEPVWDGRRRLTSRSLLSRTSSGSGRSSKRELKMSDGSLKSRRERKRRG